MAIGVGIALQIYQFKPLTACFVDLTYCLNVGLLLGGDPSSKRMRRCVDLIQTLEENVLTLPFRIPFTPMWYAMQARDELWGAYRRHHELSLINTMGRLMHAKCPLFCVHKCIILQLIHRSGKIRAKLVTFFCDKELPRVYECTRNRPVPII